MLTLAQFSFLGIETLQPMVANYVFLEMKRSAQTLFNTKLAHEAAFGLAVLYMNGVVQTDNGAENVVEGLQWLKKPALAGNPRAQASIYRFFISFQHEIPEDVWPNIFSWLSIAVFSGFFTAEEDLANLLQTDILEASKNVLRKRYGGTGAKRFADTYFPHLFPHSSQDEFDASQTEKFLQDPSSRHIKISLFGDKLLHLCASCNLGGTMSKLLDESTHDVNEGNEQGETPLLLACRAGNYHVAMQLLDSGADPNIANFLGDIPLQWLLSFKQDQVAGIGKRLVELTQGIDPVAGLWQYTFSGENAFIHGTPLMRAVSRNRIDVVRFLIDAGADSEFTTDGASAINMAAYLHYPEILALLLSKSQSQLLALDSSNMTSLLIPIFRGGCLEAPGTVFGRVRRHGQRWQTNARETLRIILEKGGKDHLNDVPGWSGVTALVLAILLSQVDIVEALLEDGCTDQINRVSRAPNDDSMTCTPLTMSIWARNFSTFELLLKTGADPNARRDIGAGFPVSSLYECARGSNDDRRFAQALIDAGVPVDEGPADYETPFACALRRRCFDLAQCLLGNGADVNIEFSQGASLDAGERRTVLGFLIQECSINTLACLEFLLQPSCGETSFLVRRSTNFGALHALASVPPAKQDDRATEKILDLLLNFFEPDEPELDLLSSSSGFSALQIAIINANVPVVERLLREGANPCLESSGELTCRNFARILIQEFPRHYKVDLQDLVIPQRTFLEKLRKKAERVLLIILKYDPDSDSE